MVAAGRANITSNCKQGLRRTDTTLLVRLFYQLSASSRPPPVLPRPVRVHTPPAWLQDRIAGIPALSQARDSAQSQRDDTGGSIRLVGDACWVGEDARVGEYSISRFHIPSSLFDLSAVQCQSCGGLASILSFFDLFCIFTRSTYYLDASWTAPGVRASQEARARRFLSSRDRDSV